MGIASDLFAKLEIKNKELGKQLANAKKFIQVVEEEAPAAYDRVKKRFEEMSKPEPKKTAKK